MALVQSLITQDKYGIKCPYSMQPKGICVHNTANDASAKNEISYMKSNNMEVSFHVAIDDVEAIQGIPFNRNAWACGDGGNGEGNRNYIQIEICYSKSGGTKFANAEKRAAKEIATLLKQYGWTINNVKKHQDFSNKYCPHRTLDNGWKRFLTMIEVELSNLNKPANTVKYRVVTGSFSSLDNANARVKELKAKGFDSFILAE
jgi:N-acetylmuramoyl-L-alanine amidase CwlA